MRFLVVSIFSTIFIWSGNSFSADIATSKGHCEKFVMSGSDVTKFCRNMVLNTSYPDGRVGFYFFLSDKGMITISGIDLPNPTPNTDRMSIDKVIVNLGIQGVPPSTAPAHGVCEYSNPYKGKAPIFCQASFGRESIIVKFRTDGKPPQIITR